MCDAGPYQMHVDRQRGGRGRRRQPPLQLGRRGEAEAQAAVGRRHKDLEVAGSGEFFQVLSEEPVLPVIAGGTAADTVQQGVGEDLFRCHDLAFVAAVAFGCGGTQ
ncbi:hypothetical protein D9M72_535090 [compost metagenome]